MAHVRSTIVVLLALVASAASLPALAQSVAAKPKTAAASAETKAAEAAKAYAAGLKAFENGKTGAAITALSAAIASGGLTNADLAKAMFYRGVAQRTEKKPAAALSDLNAAVWLRDGLSATDKAVAEDHRQALLREVGGTGGAAPVAANAPAAAPPAQTETLPWSTAPSTAEPVAAQDLTTAALPAAAPALAPQTAVTPAPSMIENVSQATGAFFGQLFGGGAAQLQPQVDAGLAGQPATAGAVNPVPAASSESWSVTTNGTAAN